jgi:hypothetical protein
MRFTSCLVIAAVAAGLLAPSSGLVAQGGETLTARLGWVPITPREQPDVTGRGSATATLQGNRLRISGTFEGLPSAATMAQLHRGVATGARGESIADLTITRAARGDISGTVELTPPQVEAFRAERLYVQVYTDRGVEDGSTLRGWFLR